MKKIVLVTTFTFLAASTLYSQSPVVYPLHLGDRWQYYGIPLMGLTKRVGGEVLMPNGQQYALIYQAGYVGLTGPSYERYDGHRMFTIPPFSQSEVLYYDFSRSVGDTISTLVRADTVDIIMSEYGIVPVFGVSRRQWTFLFRCRDTVDCGEIHTVVDSIGVTALNYLGFGSYEIQGALIEGRTFGTPLAVTQISQSATGYSLSQNYPNPFNPTTIISFGLPSRSFVSLKVFDLLGKDVATLVSQELTAGNHSRQWTVDGLPSGVYFYRISVSPRGTPAPTSAERGEQDLVSSDGRDGQAGSYTETKKLVLLK